MNSELTKKNVKGESELSLTIWPDDPLEDDFFKSLFSGQVEVKQIPTSQGKVVIKVKKENQNL